MISRAAAVFVAICFWIVFTPITWLGASLLIVPILLYWFGIGNLRNFVYRVGKAEDQLINALLFGGNPKETVSSHTGRWIKRGRPDVRARFLFVFVEWLTGRFEKDHCTNAIEEPFNNEEL